MGESENAPKPKLESDSAAKAIGRIDIFIRSQTYPDAVSIFAAKPPPLSDIYKNCICVLDTNALLVPFTIGKESIEQIRKTYISLAKAKRLVVPGQVAREFADNRAKKLGELYQQLFRKR